MTLLHFSSPDSAGRGLELLWSVSLVPDFPSSLMEVVQEVNL